MSAVRLFDLASSSSGTPPTELTERALVFRAEQLLTDEDQIAAADQTLAAHAHERAVRAADVRQEDPPLLGVHARVQTGDVAVLREDQITALAAQVQAMRRDRERVARGGAANYQAQTPNVAWIRAAHDLDAVR